MKKAAIYFSLLLIIASACSKYEEGPAISLRSKEKRLCQKWDLETITKNGVDISYPGIRYQWEFHKNGDFTSYFLHDQWGDGHWVSNGQNNSQWKWANDKEDIEILDFYEDELWFDYQIKQLKYKEMIFERNDDNDLYRYVFKIE
ncbi:MAG: hypothetical protein B7C24_01970 [Bacteroidetes bacterium 4572_77]|nr:MAG: hypothetical protein B7C24_01970 [Bacteroidetes bacterium 4572_77]